MAPGTSKLQPQHQHVMLIRVLFAPCNRNTECHQAGVKNPIQPGINGKRIGFWPPLILCSAHSDKLVTYMNGSTTSRSTSRRCWRLSTYHNQQLLMWPPNTQSGGW